MQTNLGLSSTFVALPPPDYITTPLHNAKSSTLCSDLLSLGIYPTYKISLKV